MDLRSRCGFEKSIVEDPKTGREIWRMTDYNAHDVHSYYDQFAWDPDGTKIAFSSASPDDIVQEKGTRTPKGCLFVMNADGSNLECLVEGVDFSLHTGCLPIWGVEGEKIYYHAKGHTCIVDINTKEISEIEGLRSRALSPDGSKLACQYAGSDKKGVVIVDLEDFSREEIVSGDDLVEHMLDNFNRAERRPDIDQEKAGPPVVANIKWSPEGSTLMLRFNFLPGQYMKSLFVFKPDGSGLKRLDMVTPRFGHHSWHPDGERILYCDINEIGKGRLYYLTDREGLNRKAVSRKSLGSHPIFNPEGTEIVDFAGGDIIHFDLKTGKSKILASYTNNLHSGLHPHPSWSRDGNQIIYHSDHTGTSQIYVIPLY